MTGLRAHHDHLCGVEQFGSSQGSWKFQVEEFIVKLPVVVRAKTYKIVFVIDLTEKRSFSACSGRLQVRILRILLLVWECSSIGRAPGF